MENVLQFRFHCNYHELIYGDICFRGVSAFIALEGFSNTALVMVVKLSQIFYAHAV